MLGADGLAAAAFDAVAGLAAVFGVDLAVIKTGVPVVEDLLGVRAAKRSGMEICWGQTSVQ